MKKEKLKEIFNKAVEQGGVTFLGDFVEGGPYYSVSLWPHKCFCFPVQHCSWKDVKRFVKANEDFLEKPNIALGLWIDRTGMIYENLCIDLVMIFEHRDITKAGMRQLAFAFGQKAFFNHDTGQVLESNPYSY